MRFRFIISAEGLVATNDHIVRNATFISARASNGNIFKHLKVVARNPDLDVALLLLPPGRYPTLELGNSDQVEAGTRIVAIGNPVGLEATASDGIVSAIRQGKRTQFMQITAPISSGSSGGPILSLSGRAVGISTFYIPGGQNLNFAVPINVVRELMKKITQDTHMPTSTQPVLQTQSQNTTPLRNNRDAIKWLEDWVGRYTEARAMYAGALPKEEANKGTIGGKEVVLSFSIHPDFYVAIELLERARDELSFTLFSAALEPARLNLLSSVELSLETAELRERGLKTKSYDDEFGKSHAKWILSTRDLVSGLKSALSVAYTITQGDIRSALFYFEKLLVFLEDSEQFERFKVFEEKLDDSEETFKWAMWFSSVGRMDLASLACLQVDSKGPVYGNGSYCYGTVAVWLAAHSDTSRAIVLLERSFAAAKESNTLLHSEFMEKVLHSLNSRGETWHALNAIEVLGSYLDNGDFLIGDLGGEIAEAFGKSHKIEQGERFFHTKLDDIFRQDYIARMFYASGRLSQLKELLRKRTEDEVLGYRFDELLAERLFQRYAIGEQESKIQEVTATIIGEMALNCLTYRFCHNNRTRILTSDNLKNDPDFRLFSNLDDDGLVSSLRSFDAFLQTETGRNEFSCLQNTSQDEKFVQEYASMCPRSLLILEGFLMRRKLFVSGLGAKPNELHYAADILGRTIRFFGAHRQKICSDFYNSVSPHEMDENSRQKAFDICMDKIRWSVTGTD